MEFSKIRKQRSILLSKYLRSVIPEMNGRFYMAPLMALFLTKTVYFFFLKKLSRLSSTLFLS